MEHPCYKCGAAVEDGVPFCKQCGAPQIRVVGIEPEAASTPQVPDSSQDLPAPPLRLPQVPRAGVQWSHALPGAALGGAFALLLAVIPYAVFGPAFIAGGALAVRLYRRHLKGELPATGAGARVGAASGGFGFLFSAIPAVATLVYRPDELRRAMLDNIAQLSARGYDPQKVQQVQELLKTQGGLISFVVFGLFVMLLIIVAGSSIGGAIYAAWARRSRSL